MSPFFTVTLIFVCILAISPSLALMSLTFPVMPSIYYFPLLPLSNTPFPSPCLPISLCLPPMNPTSEALAG